MTIQVIIKLKEHIIWIFLSIWERLEIFKHFVRVCHHAFNKKRKLCFTILNYTLCYTLHHKLFECTFCILNYVPFILCTPMWSLLLTLIKKKKKNYDTTQKNLIAHLLNALKTKYKLHFTTLNYTCFHQS